MDVREISARLKEMAVYEKKQGRQLVRENLDGSNKKYFFSFRHPDYANGRDVYLPQCLSLEALENSGEFTVEQLNYQDRWLQTLEKIKGLRGKRDRIRVRCR